MLKRLVPLVALALILATPGLTYAHFLWVVTQAGDKQPTAHLYFSELAEPDDASLLKRIQSAKAYVLTGRKLEPKVLPLELTDAGLHAQIPAEHKAAPVVVRHTYGVLNRNEQRFLLNYYAKTYASPLPGTWGAAEDAELLPMEIVPVLHGAELALRVLFQEQPVAGAEVTIVGPGVSDKLTGTTNEQGEFRCTLTAPGLFSIRARHSEQQAGEHNGEAYDSIRHYATLSLPFAPAKVASTPHKWPALTKGITSFGGAVDGDWLYVYGGHWGGAHHYSADKQSGEFLRLNLKNPASWETLPGGPKLTGLALVAHGRKIYRIGGFTAKNPEGQEQSLWSQADVARFDPATNQWEALPALPKGRSSLDAAVLGSTLYVVGGWNLQGDAEAEWHTTALALDLDAKTPQWKELPPPPFQRRALSLAAWQGKLYCLGGMKSKGGTTTETSIFDPENGEWSAGPALLGEAMDGFGTSSFATSHGLFVTTMSGAIQQLAADGSRWEAVGQLTHPRFFHRLLPWGTDQLVVVGGASMSTGKALELELLSPVKTEAAITAAVDPKSTQSE